MPKHTTIRIWKKTLTNLRMVYAITGESMVSIMDRVILIELERVRQVERDRQWVEDMKETRDG